MTTPEQRLAEHGIVLPQLSKPLAAYVPALIYGTQVFTSGQLPRVEGRPMTTGKLGITISVEQGKAEARQACLNALAAIHAVTGTLDAVDQIINMTVYVQCADNFSEQPQVANGASELLHEIFGDRGHHTRVAIGVNALPLNACVEVSLTAAVRFAPVFPSQG